MLKNLIASTMTVGAFSLDAGLEQLAKNGIQEFELCNQGTADGAEKHIVVESLNDKEVNRLANIINESGLKLYGINIGGTFDLDKTEYLYALAKEVGGRIITHEAGYPKEGFSNEELIRKHTEMNVKYADMGEKYGVMTSLEVPHKHSLAQSSSEIAYYWSCQDKRLCCTFDCAHLVFAGMDPMELFGTYASNVALCHIRDAVLGNSLMRYGEGDMDFARYIPFTKEMGFTGKYSMEYPAGSQSEAMEKLATSIQYLSQFSI